MIGSWQIRPCAWTVTPDGTLYHKLATRVQIEDEGCGEYIELRQFRSADNDVVGVDIEEWPALRKAIDQALATCNREDNAP